MSCFFFFRNCICQQHWIDLVYLDQGYILLGLFRQLLHLIYRGVRGSKHVVIKLYARRKEVVKSVDHSEEFEHGSKEV